MARVSRLPVSYDYGLIETIKKYLGNMKLSVKNLLIYRSL